jgi:hypothetical protein
VPKVPKFPSSLMLHGPRALAAAARARYNYRSTCETIGHLFWKHGGAARAEQVLGGEYRPRLGFCIQRGQHIDDVRIFVDEVCARVSRAATV